MKFLSEEAIDYMRATWGLDHCESLDDTNLFWGRGYHELVCKQLVNAGAVQGVCPESKEMLRVAKSIGPRVERKLIDKALAEEPYVVLCCKGCNAHHFIGEEYCIDVEDYKTGSCNFCARGPLVSETEFYKEES